MNHKLSPESEWPWYASLTEHEGDCDGSLCITCGCCVHCDPNDCGCRYKYSVCPDGECACGGEQ